MTRSGAPFHGAIGEGKIESSAASAQTPDAASAGECAVENKNKAAAAATNRLARSILASFMERPRNSAPARGTRPQDSRIWQGSVRNLTAILRPEKQHPVANGTAPLAAAAALALQGMV